MSHESLLATFKTNDEGLAALSERVLGYVLAAHLSGRDKSAEQYLILAGGAAMMERKEPDETGN